MTDSLYSENSKTRTIHVEVCLKRNAYRSHEMEKVLISFLTKYVESKELPLNEPILFDEDKFQNYQVQALKWVDSVLMECSDNSDSVNIDDLDQLVFHFYAPQHREMELDTFETQQDGDTDAVPSSSHWLLPSTAFVGLWENLIYEAGLKENLLNYALSALSFSQHNVNRNIISCNRLILLHGPPGTGKTSLCKALAQKIVIRSKRPSFNHTHLIEINSHSLFSKWFSESGKLVMRLFSKIREIVDDPQNLVCVLIDEVESLAYARDCMSGQEPKDAMRVVNALLTQLDTIKEHPNVLILATSNLADTIDIAFLDRADIKLLIGLPNEAAIRCIYKSMLLELMRVGILCEESLSVEEQQEDLLTELSFRSKGVSGRTLRKLPFLAHAVHNANATSFGLGEIQKIGLTDFLDAMLIALENHLRGQEMMNRVNKNIDCADKNEY